MYNFVNYIVTNVTASTLIGFMALIIVVSVTTGFFLHMIPSDVFMTIAGSVLTYFYKELESTNLKKQIVDKDAHIKNLNDKLIDG